MSEFAESAPAPAPAPAAPLPQTGAPLSDDTAAIHQRGIDVKPTAEQAPEPVKKAPTASEAVKMAIAESEKKAAVRADDGKFQPKAEAPVKSEPAVAKPAAAVQAEPAPAPVAKPVSTSAPDAPHREAPARFSADAKAAWETAPDAIKAESHRAIRELEQGIQKYKTDVEAFEPVRKYAEMAKAGNTTLDRALERYTTMESTLRNNPLQGLEAVVQNLGLRKNDGTPVTLYDIAHHIVGQSPDERSAGQNSTIAQLQSKIAELEQATQTVTQTFEKQKYDAVISQVTEFQKTHPRFEELSDDIGFLLETKRAKDLEDAYRLAERLNPGAATQHQAQAAVIPQAETPKPLNPAGQKSIAGSPRPGQTTGKKGANPSIQDAIKMAINAASV